MNKLILATGLSLALAATALAGHHEKDHAEHADMAEMTEEQQAMVFAGDAVNPMTGAPYKTRSVAKNPAPGKETMVMYEDQGQGEYKSMSFTLVRQN